jgi:death-on-curing protein
VTRYLSLAEYFWLAEQVTGIDTAVLTKMARIDLADSALHAPQAGFGDDDFYPELIDKAAVLTTHLAWSRTAATSGLRVRLNWLCRAVGAVRCGTAGPAIGLGR